MYKDTEASLILGLLVYSGAELKGGGCMNSALSTVGKLNASGAVSFIPTCYLVYMRNFQLA